MKLIKKLFNVINDHGIIYVIKRIMLIITKGQIQNFQMIKQMFENKSGLEVGGPSGIFRDRGFIPVYKIVKNVDGCNFSSKTIWEGNIENGAEYNYYKNNKGIQYISDATDLTQIPDAKYDFVISSNCLEHVANPLKALTEWIRVIKNDGLLLLILPKKECCFDHKRPVAEFSHLLQDFKTNIKEDDLTHLDEILELHDLKMDRPAGTLEQFKARSMNNFENRALHQHIFDTALLKEIFNYFNLEIILTHEGQEHIIIGKKNAV